MNLCTDVSEEGDDGEAASSETLSLLSYTLRCVRCLIFIFVVVYYYESMKREPKIRGIYEYECLLLFIIESRRRNFFNSSETEFS